MSKKRAAGGARSEAFYYDDHWNQVDKEEAAIVDIHEYDENGRLIGSTIGRIERKKESHMPGKKVSMDYTDRIARAVEDKKATAMDRETVLPKEDNGVDYETEYRKQTGKDFVTGDYAVQ